MLQPNKLGCHLPEKTPLYPCHCTLHVLSLRGHKNITSNIRGCCMNTYRRQVRKHQKYKIQHSRQNQQRRSPPSRQEQRNPLSPTRPTATHTPMTRVALRLHGGTTVLFANTQGAPKPVQVSIPEHTHRMSASRQGFIDNFKHEHVKLLHDLFLYKLLHEQISPRSRTLYALGKAAHTHRADRSTCIRKRASAEKKTPALKHR